jgi:hypothetical protein
MQNRKFARKIAGGVSLTELLDQLELALNGAPARTSVCRALSDLKPAARFGERASCCTGQSICAATASAPNRRRISAAVFVSVARARDWRVPAR